MFIIQDELKKLPEQPGVYLMKDNTDAIIYVGKAKILKNRVKQYFQNSSSHDNKTLSLVANICSFEYIVTDTEVEALILECNLIKKHKPKYNILLKDGKGYPYLKITTSQMFPKIFITREYIKGKDKYFGPFVNVNKVTEVLELINKIWPLRKCDLVFPRDQNKYRPCLNYHIKQCLGPCCGGVDQESYDQMVKEIISFLDGNNKEIIKKLEKEMYDFSENMEYEEALKRRDLINSIRAVSEKQKMTNTNGEDSDIIGISIQEEKALAQIFYIRDGKMLGREQFLLDLNISKTKPQLLSDFIKQYYSETTYIPKSLIVECNIEDEDIITKRLSDLKEGTVNILVPQKGEKYKLVKLANENAYMALNQFGDSMKKELKRTIGAVKEIQETLGFSETINRIEAYDISNTSGIESVGSMVVFENGKPKRSDYRKFKIKGVFGPNDYASIEEVITRRFTRYINETSSGVINGKFNKAPDLILIDGGKGQVSSAIKSLEKLNLNIRVAGMVKDDNHRTRGLLYEKNEYLLKSSSEGFKLLTRIQDEVHRFAIEYHRSLREKSQIKSVLNDIKGVGAKRRKDLLNHFGNVENIKKATLEELLAVDSINTDTANTIIEFFSVE